MKYERQSADNEPKGRYGFGFLLHVLLWVAAIGIAFGALRNIYSDTVEVGRMAMAKACAEHDPPCRAEMRHWERSGTGQTFHIHTPSGPIVVRCQREFFLAGEFRCKLRNPAPVTITAEPPAPAPKPAGSATAEPGRSATTQ